jgi:hypothetical protein
MKQAADQLLSACIGHCFIIVGLLYVLAYELFFVIISANLQIFHNFNEYFSSISMFICLYQKNCSILCYDSIGHYKIHAVCESVAFLNSAPVSLHEYFPQSV